MKTGFYKIVKGCIKILLLFLLASGLKNCSSPSKDKNPQTDADIKNLAAKSGYKIIGYVAGWKGLDISTIEAEKLTHINYAFANILNGEVVFGSEEDTIDNATLNAADLKALNALKSKNPDLKVLISIGGWTWSGNFSDVALNAESRNKFAKSAVLFMKKHQLDGVDIDWEYPNQVGDGNIFRPEDVQNFTLLLKVTREHLETQSETDGKKGNDKYLLTIASGANKTYINNTELGEAHKYLDFINIMTYDFHSGLDYIAGHHTNLYPSSSDEPDGSNILESVQDHVDAGVPANKLVLGLPFYARLWEGVDNTNNGLYQKAESTGMIVSYLSVKNNYQNKDGFLSFRDESAGAPYLWNPDSQIFISYDDEESIKLKIGYLKEKELGGVMFWEYSDDYNNSLLNTIFNGLSEGN